MDSNGKEGKGAIMLLGENTPVPGQYSPEILFPISRQEGRDSLNVMAGQPQHGVDVWHAYELSWLLPGGRPVARVGRLLVPASSPNIVESKSLKLYLNSLNQHIFTSEQEALSTIAQDVASTVGCEVQLQLFEVDDPRLSGAPLLGECIDAVDIEVGMSSPGSCMLDIGQREEQFTVYSHLLRSLCPVTGQPDWASVWIKYRGPAISRASLLGYILSYREHQEFHEQCVERMFADIWQQARPKELTVQALYTRRGGLDICPMRSSHADVAPLSRVNRQ